MGRLFASAGDAAHLRRAHESAGTAVAWIALEIGAADAGTRGWLMKGTGLDWAANPQLIQSKQAQTLVSCFMGTPFLGTTASRGDCVSDETNCTPCPAIPFRRGLERAAHKLQFLVGTQAGSGSSI